MAHSCDMETRMGLPPLDADVIGALSGTKLRSWYVRSSTSQGFTNHLCQAWLSGCLICLEKVQDCFNDTASLRGA